MITLKAHKQQLMASYFKKEVTFDQGAPDMTNASACSILNFDPLTDALWADKLQTDKETVSGQEFGTKQEILEQSTKIALKWPQAKPNDLAAMAALVMGATTTTQDAALIAYRHVFTPVAVGVALPSMQVEHQNGNIQYKYTGMKGDTFKISGKEGGYITLEADLVGSGTRAVSATAFPASISEGWMRVASAKLFRSVNAGIAIVNPPTDQGGPNIGVGATALGPRVQSFDFDYKNALKPQVGFGGNDVAQDIDFTRRSADLKMTLIFQDDTEMNNYLSQDAVALELNLKAGAAPIATGGQFYYGFDLIIPRCMLKKAALPKGAIKDDLTQDVEVDIQDDGTNPPVILAVYTAQAAYLA